MRILLSTHVGTVESVKDPEKRGRLKIRVPTVYGPAEGSIPTADLPWALPAGQPAGGSEESGGVHWLPEVGDQVYVRFLDGEPEKPIWEWALQTADQAKKYPFHQYQDSDPDVTSMLTRYGMLIQISKTGIKEITKRGYYVQLIDASEGAQDGSINIVTAKAYFIKLMDDTDQLAMFVKHLSAVFTDMEFHGDNATITLSEKMEIISKRTNIRSPRIDLGNGAKDPIIRKSDLDNVVRQIVSQFNTHTHPKVPPPTTPMKVRVTASRNTYSV